MDLGNGDFVGVIDNAKSIQEPNDYTNHHDDIKNLLNFTIHRDVGIDKPEQYADYDQGYYDRYEWHNGLWIWISLYGNDEPGRSR